MTSSKNQTAIVKLMAEYGYRFDGRILHAMPVRGWSSGYALAGAFRSPFAAAEHLIPIIAEDGYVTRLRRITAE